MATEDEKIIKLNQQIQKLISDNLKIFDEGYRKGEIDKQKRILEKIEKFFTENLDMIITVDLWRELKQEIQEGKE